MISLSLRKTEGENTPLYTSNKSSLDEEAARPVLYDSMLQPMDASVLKPTAAEISSGTALVEAAKAGNLSEVTRLIASGDVKGFINAADEDDESSEYRRATSMLWAAKYGHIDILKALIGARADVNLASQHQKSNVETNVTPISVAAVTGHTEAIRALLQAGADVNIPSEGRKFTAIHWAAMHGHAEAISALIKGGADPNICDKFGRTPLSIAAQNRHLEATEALFQGGADPRKMGYACRMYLVNWNDSHTQTYDSGRAAWYYVLVEPEKIPAFLKAMNDKIVNVVNYGKILLSGEGTDPPARVEKFLEEYGLKTPQEQEAGLKTLLKDIVRALSTIDPKTEGRLEMLRARADKLVQSRTFGTVGIMFSSDNGMIVITDVKPDSHAALCDIQPGDIIVQVKNTPVRAGNLRRVSSRLAGPLGSKVTMLCSRTRPSSDALEGFRTTLPQQHTISLVLTRDVQVHDPSVLDDALQDQEDEEEEEQVLVGWVVGSAGQLGPLFGSKNEQLKKRGSSFASDPLGEYAGHEQVVSPPPVPQMWSLHVDRIEGFSDSAGLMDKTDLFVKIIVGIKNKQEFKTQVKENVGGIAAFDEAFTFEQPQDEHLLTIQVWGKDTLYDDSYVVQTEVDLRTQQDLCVDKIGKPTSLILPVYKIGIDKPAGNVVVSLSLMPQGSRSALVSEAHAKAARAEAEAKAAAAAKAKAAGEAKEASAKAAAAAKANAEAEAAKAKAQAKAKAAVEKERKKMKSSGAVKTPKLFQPQLQKQFYKSAGVVRSGVYDDGIRLGDEDEAAFQQAGGSASAFAGVFHVTVHKIDGFSDDAGFVVLQTGGETHKTSCKDNAGSEDLVFDEAFTFEKKRLGESTLKVRVYDKSNRNYMDNKCLLGTLRDDCLGKCDVNLHMQNMLQDVGSKVVLLKAFECVHKGEPAGKVFLSFSRNKIEENGDELDEALDVLDVTGTSSQTPRAGEERGCESQPFKCLSGAKVGNLYRNADEVVCLVDRSANGGTVQRGEIGLVSSSSYTSEGGLLPANMVRVIFPGGPGLGRGHELELNAHTEIRKVLYQDKVEAKRRLAAEEAAAFFEKLLTGWLPAELEDLGKELREAVERMRTAVQEYTAAHALAVELREGRAEPKSGEPLPFRSHAEEAVRSKRSASDTAREQVKEAGQTLKCRMEELKMPPRCQRVVLEGCGLT